MKPSRSDLTARTSDLTVGTLTASSSVERDLDYKCAAFWNALEIMQPKLSKHERKCLHDRLAIKLAQPCEYEAKKHQHKYAYLKSCLPCILRGCERVRGDIQCCRNDYLEERHLRPSSLGDQTDDLWGLLSGYGLNDCLIDYLDDAADDDSAANTDNNASKDNTSNKCLKFSTVEHKFLVYLAIRHGAIHGGEWDLATKIEGVDKYPMEYMARIACRVAQKLPEDVFRASRLKFNQESDSAIKRRLARGLPNEQDTTLAPGIYHICSQCDAKVAKLLDTGKTECCNVDPDMSFCIG